MMMGYKQEHPFLGLVDSFVDSFSRLFSFISPLVNKKRFDTDAYLIMERIKEKLPQKKIESFVDTRVIPRMPDLVWHKQDINIFMGEIKKLFEEESMEKILKSDPTICLPRNRSQGKRFLKDLTKMAYRGMLKEVSEQYELMRQGSIDERSLPYLKISGEFMQTLDLIKNLLNDELETINKLNIKRLERIFSEVSLLLLRMFVIGKQIKSSNLKGALRNTRFLGIERTRVMLNGG